MDHLACKQTLPFTTIHPFYYVLFQINKLMRAGANILSPITVSVKYPPGTVVDYAYNVFYQVNISCFFHLFCRSVDVHVLLYSLLNEGITIK